MKLDLFKPILRPGLGHVTAVAAMLLVAVGIAAVDTAPTPSWMGPIALRQAVFAVFGMGVMLAVALMRMRVLCDGAFPLAMAALLLLVLLLIPGMPSWLVPVRNGARRWIDLQIILAQPSELAKIAYVLALARYLRYRQNYRRLRGLLTPLGATAVPMGLIVVEPDLGTAMIFLPVLFAMLLAAGAKIKHLLLIVVMGAALCPAMYPLLQPHQKSRIRAMVAQVQGDPSHRQGVGFQAYKAMTTSGAGQIEGYGKQRATTILRFNALPEAHNDMIFAVIVVRWGLIGGLSVLGLYLVLVVSALGVAAMTRDPFARLVVVGVATVIFTQVMVNVGMAIGLLPITGMTLPLISYGGSSLVANFIMVGLVMNAAASRPRMARPSFEFDAQQ